jgi:hypothetical protein
LGMKKAEMVAGLKTSGHWEEVGKVKKARVKKAVVKKAPVKKKAVKKAVKKATPKKPTPKKPTPKKPTLKEIKAKNLNFVFVSTLFSESSLIWVDNKYIMKKGDQLVDKASQVIGYYTDTPLWNKLAYYNYGKGDPPINGKHLTNKNEPLFIDDRKVKYINDTEKDALKDVIENMDKSYYQQNYDTYEGFMSYAENTGWTKNDVEDNWLIRDYFDENWKYLGW